MSFTVDNRQNAYKSLQRILLCLNVDTNQSSQLQNLGKLAANTAGNLYYTGTLLAKYGANAPSPNLVGWYVNFDPASANLDQKVCVGAISGEFVNGVTGADTTNSTTLANTLNMVDVIEFSIGTTYYDATLADPIANTSAMLTGFLAQYKTKVMSTIYLNDTPTTISSIQGTV